MDRMLEGCRCDKVLSICQDKWIYRCYLIVVIDSINFIWGVSFPS